MTTTQWLRQLWKQNLACRRFLKLPSAVENSPRVASEQKTGSRLRQNKHFSEHSCIQISHYYSADLWNVNYTTCIQTWLSKVGEGWKRLLEATKGGQNSNYMHGLVLGDIKIMKCDISTQVISQYHDTLTWFLESRWSSWDYHISMIKHHG